MSKVDLDAVEERAHEARRRPTTVPGYLVTKAEIAAVVASAEDVPALVAELRAARDCIDALRTVVENDTYYAQLHHQHYAEQTLELYDKVTGEQP